MPRLEPIAETARRRLTPEADLQIGGATPDAFGAGVGRAVQTLGAAGSEAAQAIQTFQLAKVREQEQAAEFERQAEFVKFGTAESQRLDETSRDIEGPAIDFTKNFMSSFDQRKSQFLEKVPQRYRPQWEAKFEALRGQVSGAALKTEFGQRDAWSRDSLKTSLELLQNGAAQTPGKIDDFRRQGEELISSSLLSRQDRAEAITAWRSSVAIAAATGDVEADPLGALRRLGGHDPVTIYDFDTGKPHAGVEGADGQIVVSNKQHVLGAIEQVESSGQRGISGPKTEYGQAHGLMQVLDSTGKELAEKAGIPWRPDLMRGTSDEAAKYQRSIGALYFYEGLKRYDGDVRKAILFYHGGPDERKWGKKTHAYLGKVLAALPRGAATVVPAIATVEPDENTLKPIPAGWRGNVEDAIQELHMTPDQAQHYLATGEDTRTAPAPVASVVSTAEGEAPAIDPRYAALPLSVRMQLIGGAQREIERRENIQHAVEQKQHAEQLNTLLNELNDGKAGMAEIESARKAGWLTDYSEISQAQNIYEQRNKQDADLVLFNKMMNTPEFAFNHFDSDQKRAVDAGVKQLGNTPMAALQVWQRTGIMATQGAQALRGAILSTDPKQVAQAASIASNIMERDPNAFTGIDGGEDIERNAALYRHYVSDLGKSQQEAVQMVAAANSPEAKRKIAASAEEERDFRKELGKSHIETDLSNKLGGWFVRDPSFTAKEQIAAVRQDYVDLAWEHYRQFHDEGAAKEYATQQINKLYGAVDGRLMKYPPTRAYPAINGSWSYLFEQAAKDIKGATGKTVRPSDVFLMPLPTATAEAFRSHKPVPYEVHYIERVDGQPVYQVLHGKAFIGDTHQAARQNSQALFEQGKRDREALAEALSRPVRTRRGRDY